jgi:hypothetical protein
MSGLSVFGIIALIVVAGLIAAFVKIEGRYKTLIFVIVAIVSLYWLFDTYHWWGLLFSGSQRRGV